MPSRLAPAADVPPTARPAAPDARSTEALLAQRTRELEAVLLALPDLYFRLDVDGRVLERRAGAAAAFHLAEHESVGRPLQDTLPDDERPRFAAALAAARRTGRLAAVEYRVPTERGPRAFEARFVPLSEGQTVALVRDITDRTDAERALRLREEHFRRLTENATDMVQIVDLEANIVYTGPSVERLLGYTPEEIAGTSAMEYLHPDDVTMAVGAMGRLVESPGTSLYVEYRVRRKDGEWRFFEAHCRTLSPTSADEGMVVNARDVTERVAAGEALRASEARYRILVDNTHDIITTLDASGRITYQSAAFERVLGHAPTAVLGRHAYELLHPDDVAQVTAAIERIVADPGSTGHAEYRYRHRDGSWRWMETFGRTLHVDSAEAGLVFNTRDVTARWRTEEALRIATAEAQRAREESERANVAKSEFLSRMSHELRTPLNSILGFAQLLQASELPARSQKGVQHILTAGEHLLTLINEVLDIARIESGRQQLSIEPVRLATVLQEAVGLVRPLAAARGIWVVDAPSTIGDGYVRADRQRLVQVLLNLLSNAVKYNRPGGQVRIRCAPVAPDVGHEPRVGVWIEDTGLGIAADRLAELFVPFARLGAERSDVEGTGLGLALSRRLVEAMGGTLALDRSSPEGSTFHVALALADDPLQTMAAHGATGEYALPMSDAEATILYVEDNLANLSLIEQILDARPGWRLVPALQGQLGIDLAREHAPDVVLLDLHLPDMPGEEVLRALRASPRTARTPVVVISADATPKTVERLLASGADAYLTKPLKVHEFLRTIDGVVAALAAARTADA